MCDHCFPRSCNTNEPLPCGKCGMDPELYDPEEQEYWMSLLAWVDAQR